MSALTLDLPADVLARVQFEARRDGDTVAEFILRAVQDNLLRRTPEARRAGSRRTVVCRDCNRWRVHVARGYCRACLDRTRDPAARRPRRIITCAACGQEGTHQGKGLCHKCYQRQRRAHLRWCRGCQNYSQEFARGLCAACYQRERRATRRGAA